MPLLTELYTVGPDIFGTPGAIYVLSTCTTITTNGKKNILKVDSTIPDQYLLFAVIISINAKI